MPIVSRNFIVNVLQDGYNNAVVRIYKRSASQPDDKPADGCTYNFATGVLSGTLNGWSQSMPVTDGTPCYVRQATVTSTEASVTINASAWTSVIKMVEDGEEGRGYKAVVYREQVFTTSQWNTYGTIGHTETWSDTSATRGTCRIGDWFQVVGRATDTNTYHILTYECTNASGNLAGTCINHQVTTDGSSPWFADLDNEMDSVACDKDGNTTSEQFVETTATLWLGSEQQTITGIVCKVDGTTIGSSYGSGVAYNYKVTATPSTGKIKFYVRQGTAIATKVIVNIEISGGTGTYYLALTINGARQGIDGRPASIYRLVPSYSEVVLKKDGTYAPTGNTYMTCGVMKNVGGTTSTPASSEYVLKYMLNGGSEVTYTATSVCARDITSSLIFILYVNSVEVDRETVSLITDGEDGIGIPGEDALTCSLDNQADQFAAAYNDVVAAQTKTTTVSMYLGTQEQTLTGLSASLYYENDTSVSSSVASVSCNATTGVVTVTISAGTFTHRGLYADITAACTNGNRYVRFTLSKVNGGDPGDPGIPGTSPELWQLALTRNNLSFSRNADDSLSPSSIAVNGYVTKTVGEEQTKYTSSQSGWRIYWGYDTDSSQGYKNIGASWNFSTSEISGHTSVWFELRNSDDSYTDWVDREVLPIIKDGIKGATGPQGKMGRNLYYAGEWSDYYGSWEVTDYKAPYFAYTSGGTTTYWAFVGANGTWYKSTAGTPSASNSNFSQMESEFKYIITEAVFSGMAKFGGSVFNGDYQFSQYGYILGFDNMRNNITDGSQYQNVDPTDMYGEGSMDANLIWNDTSERSFSDTTWQDLPFSFTTTSANRWYTIKINGYLSFSGTYSINPSDRIEWKVATSLSATAIVSGQFYAAAWSGNYDISQANFIAPANNTTYGLYVRIVKSSSSTPYVAHINTVKLRLCKFVPHYIVNMLTGRVSADKIHSSNIRHKMTMVSTSTTVLYASDEDVININGGRTDDLRIVFPNPAYDSTTGYGAMDGRIIEVMNPTGASVKYDWLQGASVQASIANFYAATDSDFGLIRNTAYTYRRIKFMCKESKWYVLWCDTQPKIKIVSSMPASPDADTLYVVTS